MRMIYKTTISIGALLPVQCDERYEASGEVRMWVRNTHHAIGHLKRRKFTGMLDFVAGEGWPLREELDTGFKTVQAAQSWLTSQVNQICGVDMLTIIEARKVLDAAIAKWESAREVVPYLPGCAKAGERAARIRDAFDAQLTAKQDYHIAVSNATAASLTEPISREALRAEINTAVRGKLDYGLTLLETLEREQLSGGAVARYDVRALTLTGASRVMSEAMWDRAMAVLERHCPRRPDTDAFCPPYALGFDARGRVCAL